MKCLLVLFLCISVAIANEICCDDGIGCFNDDPPFDNMPLPKCSSNIGLNIRVYTRSQHEMKNGEIMTRYKIAATWKPECRTVFLIHGYTESENVPWMHSMKEELLIAGDYNVVIVGWGGGARNPWYPQSAANVRTVGAEIALVANNLLNVGGTTRDKLYCVGHSLGAHTCGHAGMKSQFHHITGLDPAGPWFENKPWEIGLNPSCATHVDAIHTHGTPKLSLVLALGTMKPLGDFDFYPNGGTSQPGCYVDFSLNLPDPYAEHVNVTVEESDNGLLDESEVGLFWSTGADGFLQVIPGGEDGINPYDGASNGLMPHCSHRRAIDIYEESINNHNAFFSQRVCSDENDIPNSCKPCGDHCPQMGYNVEQQTFETESEHSLFWLETNKNFPYSKS